MTGRNQAPDPKARPGETKHGENGTETGKSETMGVDEKAARLAMSPRMPRESTFGSRGAGHYSLTHTLTEDTLPAYAHIYPGAKAGDTINETHYRTGSKLIKTRTLNGRPIPWVDFHILPNRCPPLYPIDPQEKG